MSTERDLEPKELLKELLPLELPPGPTSFERAIRFSSSSLIHEESARVIVIGTDIYYSPNSSQTPTLPPNCPTRIVRDPLKNSVEEFQSPRWWNMGMGYLLFLPTVPHFGTPPFHILYNDPMETGPRRKSRVQMDPNDTLNWKRLENFLTQLFKSFQSTYSIPDMPPIIQTSLACQSTFEYHSQFAHAEKHCRNWFAIWMAMVSFGIAIAQVSDRDSESTPLPKWYRTFVQHTDELTLSDIRGQLGQFNGRFPRAGVFINLCSPQKQPSIDFFVRFGIPVWYHWGAAEESHARQNSSWEKYIPPAHLLQKAHTFLIAAPVLKPADPASEERPWEVFFADRARHATGPMPKKKPTLKVYHWKKDDCGAWVRIRVLRQLNVETLAEYGCKQKRFDERTNEWDCGTELGELNAAELQAAAWEDENDENFPPAVVCMSQPPMTLSTSLEGTSSQPLTVNNTSSANSLESGLKDSGQYISEHHSPGDLLHLFFGFVAPPPSVCLHLQPPSEQQIKDLALAVGCPNLSLMSGSYRFYQTLWIIWGPTCHNDHGFYNSLS